MKIIGKTAKGYLIEAGTYEVANLTGYYSPDAARKDRITDKDLEIGDEIEIGAMFRQLYDLAHHEAKLNQVGETLDHCARLCRLVNPITRAMKPEDAQQ